MMIRYRVNTPSVIHQAIDGETVIINLERGLYYSLEGSAAEIWSGIAAGMSREEIVALIGRAYTGGIGDMEGAVAGFLGELTTEELIAPAAADPSDASRPDEPTSEPARRPFQRPVLRTYRDLHDLLLLDPVHNVGDAGWPTQPSATRPATP